MLVLKKLPGGETAPGSHAGSPVLLYNSSYAQMKSLSSDLGGFHELWLDATADLRTDSSEFLEAC